jgi:DNA modification methylase
MINLPTKNMQGSYNNHPFNLINEDIFTYLHANTQILNKYRLIIIDPPYSLTQNIWDQTIFDLTKLWDYLLNILLDDGSILIFSQQPFSTDVILSKRDLYRYEIIWLKEKGTRFFEAEKRLLPAHENIQLFSKKYPHLFNPIKFQGKPYKKLRKKENSSSNYQSDSKDEILTTNNGDRYPLSYLYFPRDNANIGIHPTQKPVDLLRFLIKTYSNENDSILDICSGSGSTMIASLMEKRNVDSIEKDKTIYEKACNRLSTYLIDGKDHLSKKDKTKQSNNLDHIFLSK